VIKFERTFHSTTSKKARLKKTIILLVILSFRPDTAMIHFRSKLTAIIGIAASILAFAIAQDEDFKLMMSERGVWVLSTTLLTLFFACASNQCDRKCREMHERNLDSSHVEVLTG
jgi:hypothetical protein